MQKSLERSFWRSSKANHIFSDYINDSEIFCYQPPLTTEISGMFRPIYSNYLESVIKFPKNPGCFRCNPRPFKQNLRVSRFRNSIPNKQKLLQAQKRVGFKKIKFHPNEKPSNTRYDSRYGGIAKGYAADRMLSAMRANGITRCLIDAGGDLVIGKPPRGKKGWRVRIGEKIEDPLEVLSLSECYCHIR